MSLEIRHLTKFYGKKQALCDVSVTFHENKIYGLFGRNGAGKTTMGISKTLPTITTC